MRTTPLCQVLAISLLALVAHYLAGTLHATPLPEGTIRQDAPGFAIADEAFRDYYQKRGGLRTFGHPISREFRLHGFRVQLFQRGIMQAMPGGGVATMNLLDAGLMPYGSFNFSVVPTPQRALAEAAPGVSEPDYASAAIAFVRANAPDEWEGLPVNFFATFMSTVRYEDAFPNGEGDPALLPLLNLELWGLPTSRPAYDPNNHGFVYQRFQRGIMHYDASTGATQGLLLGEYFKAVLTGRDLPGDVRSQASASPFYLQYDVASGAGPLRSGELLGTDLSGAFLPRESSPIGSPTPAARFGEPDPRFGVVVVGPGSGDPRQLEAVLSLLGAHNWYSFDPNAAQASRRVELVRPGADLGQISARARSYPGRAWMIGNEPNVPGQDDLKPAAYSDFLFRAAGAIKAADPTARLVGPNVLNWDKVCDGCPGYPAGHGWSDQFLADYRSRYGPLPFDVWGMHAYSLDWDHPPLVDAPADQAQLAAARAWLDANGLNLPIWLTEFGVIWGYEGIEWEKQGDGWIGVPSGSFRTDLMAEYMDSMFGWLVGSGGRDARVERWFLYATTPPREPYATVVGGISLLESGRLAPTPFGERFRGWATGARGRE